MKSAMNSEKFLIETSVTDRTESELDRNQTQAKTQITAVDGQIIKANIDKLTSLVQHFGQDIAGHLELDEVSISLKINAEGEVILLGSGAQNTGTMTLRFRRSARSYSKLAQPASKSQDLLTSAVGVNYTNLQNMLSAGRWQEANQETWDVMCQALRKNKGSYLSSEDVKQLPTQDLKTIDHLWRKHSHGRFGFSVQKSAYEKSL